MAEIVAETESADKPKEEPPEGLALAAAEIIRARQAIERFRERQPDPPCPGGDDPIPVGAVWLAPKALTEADGMAHETADGKLHPITKPVTLQIRYPYSRDRKATRFVAKFYEQAGHPGLALQTAEAVAALLNCAEELRILRELAAGVRRSTGGVAFHERIADPDTGMLGPIASCLADLDRLGATREGV